MSTGSTKVLVSSDLHQWIPKWEELVEVVGKEEPRFVLIAGDLLPKSGGYTAQKNFFSKLNRYCREMKRRAPVTVLTYLGNDDFHVLEPLLDHLEVDGLCINLMERSIWMIHQSPSELGMDICGNGQRVGSSTVLRFAANNQPLLGCSGHIHESPYQVGGNWMGRIGKTVWLQPGQIDFRLHYVTVEITKDFSIRSIHHSIFGNSA